MRDKITSLSKDFQRPIKSKISAPPGAWRVQLVRDIGQDVGRRRQANRRRGNSRSRLWSTYERRPGMTDVNRLTRGLGVRKVLPMGTNMSGLLSDVAGRCFNSIDARVGERAGGGRVAA